MDGAILQSIQSIFGGAVLNGVMPVITTLGELGFIWVVVGVSLAITKKYRAWGIGLLVAIACSALLVEGVIKPLVGRPRPFQADPSINLLVFAPLGSSFPSGHTSAAVAAATVLCASPLKLPWKIGAVIVAVLIAFSRLYLQVHYPTDVLGGCITGLLVGFLAVFFIRLYIKKHPKAEVKAGNNSS